MNIWMDTTIALAIAWLLLATVTFLILLSLSRYKAANTVLIGYEGEYKLLRKTLEEHAAQRDAAQLQSKTYHQQVEEAAQRIVELLAENGTLALQLKEATEARTRAARTRTSRAKPTAAAE